MSEKVIVMERIFTETGAEVHGPTYEMSIADAVKAIEAGTHRSMEAPAGQVPKSWGVSKSKGKEADKQSSSKESLSDGDKSSS